ncbi:hypothetical protein QJQ45_018560 [Haematococcus lacustris]|nr:hypothetical protein QJQ45_018560 [Haematococcus lacustris]
MPFKRCSATPTTQDAELSAAVNCGNPNCDSPSFAGATRVAQSGDELNSSLDDLDFLVVFDGHSNVFNLHSMAAVRLLDEQQAGQQQQQPGWDSQAQTARHTHKPWLGEHQRGSSRPIAPEQLQEEDAEQEDGLLSSPELGQSGRAAGGTAGSHCLQAGQISRGAGAVGDPGDPDGDIESGEIEDGEAAEEEEQQQQRPIKAQQPALAVAVPVVPPPELAASWSGMDGAAAGRVAVTEGRQLQTQPELAPPPPALVQDDIKDQGLEAPHAAAAQPAEAAALDSPSQGVPEEHELEQGVGAWEDDGNAARLDASPDSPGHPEAAHGGWQIEGQSDQGDGHTGELANDGHGAPEEVEAEERVAVVEEEVEAITETDHGNQPSATPVVVAQQQIGTASWDAGLGHACDGSTGLGTAGVTVGAEEAEEEEVEDEWGFQGMDDD